MAKPSDRTAMLNSLCGGNFAAHFTRREFARHESTMERPSSGFAASLSIPAFFRRVAIGDMLAPMNRTLAAIGVALGLVQPAAAADLSGQWNVHLPESPAYVGVILIDAENRATLDSPLDNGKPARFVGYVKAEDGGRAEIILTDRGIVTKLNCSKEAGELMYCRATYPDGRKSSIATLTRVGPGPRSLAPTR